MSFEEDFKKFTNGIAVEDYGKDIDLTKGISIEDRMKLKISTVDDEEIEAMVKSFISALESEGPKPIRVIWRGAPFIGGHFRIEIGQPYLDELLTLKGLSDVIEQLGSEIAAGGVHWIAVAVIVAVLIVFKYSELKAICEGRGVYTKLYPSEIAEIQARLANPPLLIEYLINKEVYPL